VMTIQTTTFTVYDIAQLFNLNLFGSFISYSYLGWATTSDSDFAGLAAAAFQNGSGGTFDSDLSFDASANMGPSVTDLLTFFPALHSFSTVWGLN